MSGKAWITATEKVWAGYVTISAQGGGWIVEAYMGRVVEGNLDWFYYPPLSYKDEVATLPSFTFEECVEKIAELDANKLRLRIRNIQTNEIVSGAIIDG